MRIPTKTFLDDFLDWAVDHGVVGALILCAALFALVGTIIGGAAIVVTLINSDRPKVTLYADEWTPTLAHRETRRSMILVGKVMVPQVRTVTVVDQWTRR